MKLLIEKAARVVVHSVARNQMANSIFSVSREEKYFFDLSGYLIVRGVLTQEDVARCNEAIDHCTDEIVQFEPGQFSRGSKALAGDSSRKQLTGMLGWPAPYRDPFRDLLVHPIVVSRLNTLCGKGFRLDHGPLLIAADQGAEGHFLHGAGEPFKSATWYKQQNGSIYCRGVTVAWQLADANSGDGGFAIIPGSHKANEPTPDEVRSVEDTMDLVVQPAMKAGDLLFFAETVTHGALPWKAKHERRSLLYKYTSRAAARAVGRHFTPEERHGAWTNGLTLEQQAVLYGPGIHDGGRLPILESDGERTWVAEQ